MKALTLTATGGLEHLELRDVPVPELTAPTDVLVRVHTAALNRLDLFVADGLPGIEYRFPHIVGSDGAGVVEAAGPAVWQVRPGDRVMINPTLSCGRCFACQNGDELRCPGFGVLGEHRSGTAADYIVVPAANLAPVPPDMPWPDAAAFSLATLTAWRMLVTRAKLQPDETVLIWGIGGGVAQAALRIATLLGARTIVTSGTDAKLDAARAIGADATINHATGNVVDEVRRLTGRAGADVIVDSVGERTWSTSLRVLRRGGRLVVCGATTGPAVAIDLRRLFWYQWSILGSTLGGHAEYAAIVALAQQGKLWPSVDRVVPLADGVAAFRRLAQGEQVGKLVLEVTP